MLSDGGDTSRAGGAGQAGSAGGEGGPPVFAVGIGSPDGPRDREVLGITAGDPHLDQASRRSPRDGGQLRLRPHAVSAARARQRPIARHARIVPPADGSPIDEVFTVSPDPLNATVYSAEIPVDDNEVVAENNTRAVLVSPAGRKRRVLVVEGAPGFEHSFMKRALASDPGLEVDSVTRKGRNAENQDTFFVQAAGGRSAALTTGFPPRRQDLFAYDGLIVANVETDFFTRAQLAMAADFVAERGGGLLVLGGRSFAQRGLAGTPLEEVLPVEVNDRLGGLVRTSLASGSLPPHNKVMLTDEGESASDHANRRARPTRREAMGRAADAGVERRARRSTAGGDDPRADHRPWRRHLSGRRRAALRTGTVDDLRRRGVVAMEDDGRLERPRVRVLLAAGGAVARVGGAGSGGDHRRRCAGARRCDVAGRRGAGRDVRARSRRHRRSDADRAGRRHAVAQAPACRMRRAAGSRPRSSRSSQACTASTPRRAAERRRSAPPIGGCMSAARTASSPIRG